MSYAHLFTPIKIGPKVVKNRIVMSPMNTNFADPAGFVSRRFLNYYVARARGEAGLIIISAAFIDEKAKRRTGNIGIYDDIFIDGLANLAKEIKNAGSAVFQQLNHVGRLLKTMTTPDSKYQAIGPSAIPHPITGERCKELSIDEIKEIARKFAAAAGRVKKAGFDGLEIHGAHGYLLNQFLSRHTNKRNDEYGGSLDGRMKLPLEVIKEVRSAVGDDFPISYRISAKEFVHNGLNLEEIKIFSRELEKAGVNIIHVSGGGGETTGTVLRMIPPMSAEPGCFVPFGQEIKGVLKIPVIVAGKINSPDLAEEIIREGKSDMVAMGRALIADPELPLKVKEGRVKDIRKCIYCNQGCMERLIQEKDITCTVNPAVGKEEEYKIIPAQKRKRIFVVGSGPAGMESARVLASRQHTVTLFEKEGNLGGQLLVAVVPPGKDELRSIIEYYSNQLAKLRVTLKLNTELTNKYIEEENPDAVVLAIGSSPVRPKICQGDNCFTAQDVLRDNWPLEDEIAVVGGGQVGLEVALFVAKRVHKVKVIEMLGDVGGDMGPLNKFHLKECLKLLDVDILCNTKFLDIKEDSLEVEVHGKKKIICNIKTVIFAIGSKSNDALETRISKSRWKGEVFKVGDCNKPRKILDAISEGFEIGLAY